jgi:hypothetical protein
LLLRAYYNDIEKFLTSYRKETVDAKKEGKLDEQEADPISWPLFKLILSWALDTSNIFVWTYSILQWNCTSILVHLGFITFKLARIISCADTMIPNRYIRPDHANSHGICKGSATKVTSGTTLHPPNIIHCSPRQVVPWVNPAYLLAFCRARRPLLRSLPCRS